jgi:hypothetical protein
LVDEPVWLNIDLLGSWPLGQLPFLLLAFPAPRPEKLRWSA